MPLNREPQQQGVSNCKFLESLFKAALDRTSLFCTMCKLEQGHVKTSSSNA